MERKYVTPSGDIGLAGQQRLSEFLRTSSENGTYIVVKYHNSWFTSNFPGKKIRSFIDFVALKCLKHHRKCKLFFTQNLLSSMSSNKNTLKSIRYTYHISIPGLKPITDRSQPLKVHKTGRSRSLQNVVPQSFFVEVSLYLYSILHHAKICYTTY